MTPSLEKLADLMQIDGLSEWYGDESALMPHRDEIKSIMAAAIRTRTTADWLAVLQPADIWCSEVLDWSRMLESEAFQSLDFQQVIRRNGTVELNALRGPLRIDRMTLKSDRAAPALGADRDRIITELFSDQLPAESNNKEPIA
jgi:crotonobetainyl-CoA:carnitine CoA-transferase CaiB-like acyl-CoA transferase